MVWDHQLLSVITCNLTRPLPENSERDYISQQSLPKDHCLTTVGLQLEFLRWQGVTSDLSTQGRKMRFLFLNPQTNELRWTADSLSSLLQDTSQHAWASRMRKTNNIRSRACAVFFSVGHQQKSESWQVLKQTWLCPPYSISLWSLLHKAACKVIKCLVVAHSFKWLTQACPEWFFNAIQFLNLQCTFFWHPEMSYQTKHGFLDSLCPPNTAYLAQFLYIYIMFELLIHHLILPFQV